VYVLSHSKVLPERAHFNKEPGHKETKTVEGHLSDGFIAVLQDTGASDVSTTHQQARHRRDVSPDHGAQRINMASRLIVIMPTIVT
jgi:hypothetical protein